MVVTAPVDKVADVAPEISAKLMLSVELCHCMVPVLPVRVMVVLPDWQKCDVAVAVAVPPTDGPFTITETVLVSVQEEFVEVSV